MLKYFLPVLLLLLVFAAALALGADEPPSALFSSGAIAMISAVVLLASRRMAGSVALVGLIGASLFFVIGLLNGWGSTGAGEYSALVAAFGVLATSQVVGRDVKMVETLWRATLSLGALLAGAAFIDFIVDSRMLWGIMEHPYGGVRLSAPFLSANTAATFFGVIALVGVAELTRAIRRPRAPGIGGVERLMKDGALPLMALLLSLTCVLLTASRAGITFLIGAVLLLAVWEIVRSYRPRSGDLLKMAGMGVAVVATLGIVFFVSSSAFFDRMELQGFGSNVRETSFAAYSEAIILAPVLGHGLGGFFYINSLIAEAQNAPALTFQGAAHNVVLQWLLQGGLVGLGFVVAISLAWLHVMRQGLMRRRRQRSYMRAAIVIALFVVAHGMFDYALEIPAFLFLFAWVCGLGAGVATGGSKTLSPKMTRVPPRTLNYVAAAILVSTSGLSFWALSDRLRGQQIINMEGAAFRAEFDVQSQLRGSPHRLAAIGDRAMRLDPPDAAMAAQAFEQASEKEPRDGVLHLRYAIARIAETGAITPDAVAALARSYTVMPYAPRERVNWRLDVVEGIWPHLPVAVHEAAIREARAYRQARRVERLLNLAESTSPQPGNPGRAGGE